MIKMIYCIILHYFIISNLLTFFQLVFATPNIYSNYDIAEYPNIKYCFSSMDLLDGGVSSNYFTLKRELDKNCTHIYGNILINGITRGADGTEPDLRFLSTIVEITGSLKIKNSPLSKIPLNNLAIIRGNSKLHKLDDNESLRNSLEITLEKDVFGTKSFNTIFDLGNLRSIVSGDVQLSPFTCSLLANVNWNELLEDPKQQNVRGECNFSLFICSSKCPIKTGKRYCWGKSLSQCQKFSKCEKRTCANRCYISQSGEEECCSSQCLGGCSSSTADSCIACEGVLDKGKCQSECPRKTIINRETGSIVANKDFMPSFVNICVKKCPASLLEQEGECRSQCTMKKYEKKGDKCVPCVNYCEQICTMEEVFSEFQIQAQIISLDSKKIKKISNCTTLKGSIMLDKESFIKHQHLQDNEPITNVSDLFYLNNLRVVTGSIYIDLKDATFNVNSLSFLSNLEVIEGNSFEIPLALGIFNTNITYLGLQNLNHIGLRGHATKPITIQNNSNLCYFDVNLFKKALKFNEFIYVRNTSNSTKCVSEGKICSSKCDSSFGCWGPGPTQCHRCAKKKLGIICGDNCNDVPGYFQSKVNSNSDICLKCHDECSLTCSGQGSHECIGGCKHALEGLNCVAQCSRTHYLDRRTNMCKMCNAECHPRNLTRLPVCTGPLSKPGFLGCKKCQTLVLDQNLNLERCTNKQIEPHFFSENLPKIKESPFSQYTEKFTDLIVTYRPCNHMCSKCTFATNQRIKAPYPSQIWNGCLNCKGYWFIDSCVSKCPKNKTYLLPDKKNSSRGECHACHPQCDGCYEATNYNCLKCKHYRVDDMINSSKFICVDSCPNNYKEKFFNSKLNQTICLNVFLTKLELLMVAIAVVFIVILVIFVLIITKICYTRKEKRRKNKLKAFFSNANENDSSNFKKPNMYKLPLLRTDNLKFDLNGDYLGKGAFGTVYLGKWMPTDNDFDDSVSLTSCKDKMMDVAIKVVNESCSVDEFMEEVKIMASVRHKHCLRLIGVCFMERNHLLISSYIHLGSMDKYLINNKSRLTGHTLLLWAEQIANGMYYLEQNHIIHRDLATRNVLMFQEDHVQITDFGLAKVVNSDNIRISSGIVPVRWLAIESIRDGMYSHKTDIWAYAVTLWEIFTFAKTPYNLVKANDIRDEIIKGTRLCQPEICSLEIYILMLKCWSVDPNERPNFQYVWNEFKMFCTSPKTYLSYPNNNDSRPSNHSNSNYLQIVKDDSSRHPSNETLILSLPNQSMIFHRSQSDINIPVNIRSLLNEHPTINMIYQPADDIRRPLIPNFNNQNGFHSHQFDSPNFLRNKITTEYLEPHNIGLSSSQER